MKAEAADVLDLERQDLIERYQLLADRIRGNRPGNSRGTVLLALETADAIIRSFQKSCERLARKPANAPGGDDK